MHVRNILLTGANSPTGRSGLRWLRQRYPNATVFAASRAPIPMPGVTPILLDLDRTGHLGLPPLDAVLHLAAVTPTSTNDPHAFMRINADGAKRFFASLRYAHGAAFFNFSSLSVYAPSSRPEITEDHPRTNTDPYGMSKHAFEAALADLAADRGLRALSARIPVLLAPGVACNFMAKWRDALLAGREFTLFNPDADFNACVWWEDLFVLFATFLRSGQVGHLACNTAAAKPITVREVAVTFSDALGVAPVFTVSPSPRHSQLVKTELAVGMGLPARNVVDAIVSFAEGSRPS